MHSILHEASHYICMTPERRAGLDRDAGGDDLEESAVCYLQVLLADTPRGRRPRAAVRGHGCVGLQLRLGSTRAWFEDDADDARLWLVKEGVITSHGSTDRRARGTRSRRATRSRSSAQPRTARLPHQF